MSVHRNDLSTGIFFFFFEDLLKLNPVQASIQGGWVLNLDYRWNLKLYNNFQNNQTKSGSYCTDFRSASLIILDLKLLLLWYLFVSVLILIELQRKSKKSYYKHHNLVDWLKWTPNCKVNAQNECTKFILSFKLNPKSSIEIGLKNWLWKSLRC